MRGCNGREKKCMIVDMFEERKLDVLGLCETKVKGRGVQDWEGERVIVSGVSERSRAREGVAVLVTERLWGSVKEHGCVSSRIVWVKMKVGIERIVVVCAYAPGMERSQNEREMFWEQLSACLAGFSENERVIVLGDLNAKVGDRERYGVVGKYGVPGVNENGESLVEMCVERRMIVGNTWFDKRLINKYTWSRENGNERSMLDHVLVQNKWRAELLDVTARRGITAGMTDHCLLEVKVRMKGFWKNVKREGVKEVIRSSELSKLVVREEYRKLIEREWQKLRDKEVVGADVEWMVYKNSILEMAGKVCGLKKVGRKSKRSVWWDEEMRELVKEKRRLYEVQLQTASENDREKYKEKKREVKRIVNEKKSAADDEWGERVTRTYKENKKMFWAEVNAERKVKEKLGMSIKDVNGNLLHEESEVKSRWNEYFCNLLNVENGREAMIGERRMYEVGAQHVIDISVDDVRKAIKKLKNGKSPGVDGITSEMLRYGGDCMVEWLTRVCRVCLDEGRVPDDWIRAVIVPIYKGKGDKCECKNYRGISLLSIPGKVYGRVVIEKVRELTERLVGEEQGGFRQGRGCVDQIFVMNQLSEKYVSKGKSLHVAYIDLEKAYDRVDREAMWRVLEMYGVNGRLLQAVKSFYVESKACVRICRQESEWFNVRVGLRQGCVMSPWLFNVFLDGVMKEVKERVGDVGASLWDERRNCEWKVAWVMYADDTAFVADSVTELQRLIEAFGVVCQERKLSVNVDKSKVMKISGSADESEMNVILDDKRMEEVQKYRYLGTDVANDGRMHEEISHRITEARKAAGALGSLWKRRNICREAKVGMFEGIVEPSLMYGSEVWVLNKSERKKIEAVEMNCLRSICGVRRIDRVRNEEVRRMCGKERSVGMKIDQSVLRWFGHVERMNEERMVRRVYESSVNGTRRRGRPRKCWMDGVVNVLNERGLNIETARQCVNERSEWRSVCRGDRRAAGGAP